MNNKMLTLFDNNDCKDHHSLLPYKTDIRIFVEGTDELVFRGSNKVILPGAAFTARAHFDISNPEITPSYNEALGLENTTSDPTKISKCYLFAVGTDGCDANNNSNVYTVEYEKWISTSALVPFRYPKTAEDDIDRGMYFGRKTGITDTSGNTYNAYYFKRFDAPPVLKQRYIADASQIGNSISVNISNGYYNTIGKVETYVEIGLKVTKEDCREFFNSFAGGQNARINTISLLTAWSEIIDGNVYYQDIRPLTKLNFPNESLIDTNKGLDIVYHIYY